MRNGLVAIAAAALVAGAAHAQSVEDFYHGRTVTVLVGFSPGGAYDGSARLLAQHMGKYIPGRPSFVVQNMPGAGTLNLVNHLYNVAPKDGTVFGIFARGMAMEPLIGNSDTRFDATKLTWIGSTTNEVSLCATYGTSPVKTWQDTLTKDFVVAGNGSGSDPDVFANVLRHPVRPEEPADHRLSRQRRDLARHGARRGRRALRLVVEQREGREARLAARP
jgi:tripartite-type tricarboxylate transporter receptor subunit TctC